jgi:hypothetical protein
MGTRVKSHEEHDENTLRTYWEHKKSKISKATHRVDPYHRLYEIFVQEISLGGREQSVSA